MMHPRTILTLILYEGSIYKTVNFEPKIYCGDPANVCAVYSDFGVDEILLIDKDAKLKGINYQILEKLISDCFVPITYCGAVRTMECFTRLINIGFDRIGFGVEDGNCDYELVRRGASEFGLQSTVALLSYVEQYVHRYTWDKVKPQKLGALIKKLPLEIFSEIVLQSVTRDGTRQGIDIAVLSDTKLGTRGLILSGGAKSFSEVEKIKMDYGMTVGVSSIATLYKNDGVLLQWKD